MENRALAWEIDTLNKLYDGIRQINNEDDLKKLLLEIKTHFNSLMDVEKHYLRKENLLFPFLEKHGVTGPPKVMWGKHDETRELLKAAMEVLDQQETMSIDEAGTAIEFVLKPASDSIEEMILKEDEILFPMTMDKLETSEWYQIYRQSPEIGFCLHDPETEWRPAGIESYDNEKYRTDRIQLPSGSFTPPEIQAILNTIPFDLTFVDKDDRVRYFTQGRERIFTRNRAILGRLVQNCHPPSSVHVVEKIISDFKNGKEDHCAFWINMHEKFIHIEYHALRDDAGEYLGVLEVSQDLTEKRALAGEKRLLSYEK
jgi:DUF438 domain-containing protein